MNTKIITLEINKKIFEPVTAKQGDTSSRFLLFNLYDNSTQFNLTGRTVRAYAIKPDGKEIYNDLVINDAAKGLCTLELTTQMLALDGDVNMELVITEGTKKLSSIPFVLRVIPSLNSDDAVLSTNEFTLLQEALSSVQNIDNRFAEVNASLETMKTKINWVDPDSFTGSDYEKLQKAYDKAIEIGKTYGLENRVTVVLNRLYNVGDNTIKINKDFTKFILHTTSNGVGGIRKDTSGFLFSSDLGLRNSGLRFTNITFASVNESGVKLFDCDSLLAVFISDCDFYNIGTCIYADKYMQSIRFYNNTIWGGTGTFIDSNECYDVKIINNECETRAGSFIRCSRNKTGGVIDCKSLIIENNIIEGLFTGVAIIVGASHGLVICKNYFEANVDGDIKDDVVTPQNHTSINISDNISNIGSNNIGKDNYFASLTKGVEILKFDNNRISNRKTLQHNSSVCVNQNTNDVEIYTNSVFLDNISISKNLVVTKDGSTAKFKSGLIRTINLDFSGQSYLCSLSGTTGYGASSKYNYTLILSINSEIVSGEARIKPTINLLNTTTQAKDITCKFEVNGAEYDYIVNSNVASDLQVKIIIYMPYTYGNESGTILNLSMLNVFKGNLQPYK